MACTSPNRIRYSQYVLGNEDTDVRTYFLGAVPFVERSSFDPIEAAKPKFITDGSGTYRTWTVMVPCGKCKACRFSHSADWAARMLIELKDNNYKAVFLTLTYDNNHVPVAVDSSTGLTDGMSLRKSDLSLALKRFRRHFTDKLGLTIRQFSCGEYGPKTLRPHYHMILFGVSLSDFSDLKIWNYNELGQPIFTDSIFSSLWPHGRVVIADCNYKTCAYVARYCVKKRDRSLDSRMSRFAEPEFINFSRRPGIGMLHLNDMVLKISDGFYSMSIDGKDGVHSILPPKTVIKRSKELGLDLSEYSYLKAEASNARLTSILSQTDLKYYDLLDNQANDYNRLADVILPRRDL